MPVWILHSLREQGVPVSELMEAYPFLNRDQIDEALQYADDNVEEIERDWLENQTA